MWTGERGAQQSRACPSTWIPSLPCNEVIGQSVLETGWGVEISEPGILAAGNRSGASPDF